MQSTRVVFDGFDRWCPLMVNGLLRCFACLHFLFSPRVLLRGNEFALWL